MSEPISNTQPPPMHAPVAQNFSQNFHQFKQYIKTSKISPLARRIVAGIRRRVGGASPSSVTQPTLVSNFVPVYQIFSRPGTFSEVIYGWRGRHTQRSHINITAGTTVRFSLDAREQGILGMHFMLGTHNRKNSSTLRIAVYCCDTGEATPVGEIETAVSDLLDNELNYFSFGSQLINVGSILQIEITSRDATPENCIALWGTFVSPENFYRKNSTVLHPDYVDFQEALHIVTPYYPAPRKERFIPRFSAVCSDSPAVDAVMEWRGICLASKHQPIFPGSSAEITFKCTHADLSKIMLQLVNFERVNSCSVDLILSRSIRNSWVECHRHTVNGRQVSDTEPVKFAFPNIQDSAGNWFRVTISSDDASSQNCIGVQGTAVLEDGHLFNELSRCEDTVSMVDGWRSQVDLGRMRHSVPLWANLHRDPNRDNFKVVLLIEDDASDALPAALLTQPEITVRASGTVKDSLPELMKAHLVVVADVKSSDGSNTVLELCRHCCIPTLALGYGTLRRDLQQHEHQEIAKGTVAATAKSLEGKKLSVLEGCDFRAEDFAPLRAREGAAALEHLQIADLFSVYNELAPTYRTRRLPKISVISILYRKEAEIAAVLESLATQDYPGEVEIVLVDDQSPDQSRVIVERLIASRPAIFGAAGRMPIRLLTNEQNIGNCGSRNKAIEQATGDVFLIIDADCVLNSGCLSAHGAAHSRGDVDVVIGTHNLETNGKDPAAVIQEFERDFLKTQLQAQLQDPTVPGSFLNAITRNVSINRKFADARLFDEAFSYSRDPLSGFGWEDVEMGCRLFKRGARFVFTNRAISVHISHASSCDEGTKPARSIKNFRRLLEKHQDLRSVSRRWVLDTFQKICAWMDNSGIHENEDRRWVERHLQGFDSLRNVYKPRPQKRILSFRWHCPHQYELYKLPHQFTLFSLAEGIYSSSWAYEQRPLRHNVSLKGVRQIDPRDYDLAILHFDENVLFPENTQGVLGATWGASFRWMRENLNLPTIAVCHGTPQFNGQYYRQYFGADAGSPLEYERSTLVEYLGDIAVVCNSHQARAEWGFRNSRVIWQGFDPMEFGPEPTGEGILTLGPPMKERPIYRGYDLFRAVQALAGDDLKFHFLKVPNPPYDYGTSGNDFAWAKFRLYNQEIRKHSIYFNPTQRSPMPRSRGEAMMSGLVSVSANNHDVSLFIKNGINGFYSNDSYELVDYLRFLVRNPEVCARLGRASRALAADVFNIDRYHRDWNQLIQDVAG